MKLGAKVLLAIALSLALMFGVTYWGSLKILQSSYIKLETQEAKTDINNIKEALIALETINSTALLAFANWDTFYALMVDKNPVTRNEFLDANYAVSSLAIYNLDFVLVYDTNGNLAISRGLNQDRSAFIPVAEDILKFFQPHGKFRKLVVLPANDNATSGLIATHNGITIIGTNNISDTPGKAPSRGTIIFGQYINDNIWNKLKTSTKLDMTLYPLPLVNQDPQLKKEYTVLLTKGDDHVILNNSTLNLYTLVRDINSEPIGMIKINMPRGIHQLGLKTIHYFNMVFLGIGIFFAILLFYLLRLIIIRRLEKINNKVMIIENKKDFTLRVPEEGSDEISSIGKKTNEMLASIEAIEILLTDIINSMPSALIIVDKQIYITNFNKLAEKESGLSLKEAKGKLLVHAFPFLKKFQEKILMSITNRQPQEINKIPIKTQNTVRYFNAVIYPLSGEEQSLAIRLDDVTQMLEVDQRRAQTDKLASIGVLTAGVAHEIKNPINFVSGAVPPLKKDIQDIISLLEKYSDITSKTDLISKKNDIETLTKGMDIDYTINEIRNLIDGIKEGSYRIALIVQNLKLFSQLEEDAIKEININATIDSALCTLWSEEINNRISLIKEYADLPLVSGFYVKLNQAFMNIISNAMDAIVEKGKVKIKTECINDSIKISIHDTGIGISDENLPKIFDPFFTTKEVGKGLGLGLSTVASIIRDHNGTIEVKSHLSEGTEVIILLPIII
jgi:PAS domain S-box-containing protein